MAKSFISVKETQKATNLLINTNHIVYVKQTGSGIEVALSNGDKFIVDKKFTELRDSLVKAHDDSGNDVPK